MLKFKNGTGLQEARFRFYQMGDWRNGIRIALKTQWGNHKGSNPLSPRYQVPPSRGDTVFTNGTTKQDREVVSRRVHISENEGSSPSPATILILLC